MFGDRQKGLPAWLVNEIQQVYRLLGVGINDKHIEVIVRQMLRRVRIKEVGNTNFLVDPQSPSTCWSPALPPGSRCNAYETRRYSYERRRPEATTLQQVVRENLLTLYAAVEQGFGSPLTSLSATSSTAISPVAYTLSARCRSGNSC